MMQPEDLFPETRWRLEWIARRFPYECGLPPEAATIILEPFAEQCGVRVPNEYKKLYEAWAAEDAGATEMLGNANEYFERELNASAAMHQGMTFDLPRAQAPEQTV